MSPTRRVARSRIRIALGAASVLGLLCAWAPAAPGAPRRTSGSELPTGAMAGPIFAALPAGQSPAAGGRETHGVVVTDRFTAMAVVGLAALLLILFFAQRRKTNQFVEQLGYSERRYRSIIEGFRNEYFFYARNAQGAYTYVSPSVAAVLGCSPAQFLSGVAEWIARCPGNAEPMRRAALGLQGEEQPAYRLELAHASGEPRWLEIKETPVLSPDGRVASVEGIARDITESIRSEQALRAAETKCRLIVDGAAEGILVTDVESMRFTYANPAICEMLGYSADELLKMSLRDIHPPEELDRAFADFLAQSRGAKPLSAGVACRRKDGRIIRTDVRTAVISHDGRRSNVGFFTDVTTRRYMEEQFRRAQKLEAVGQLAGGVAHEFNNLLMGVGGYAQLLLGQFKDDQDVSRDLSRICQLAERGAKLSRQLLTFSRCEAGEPRVISFNSVVADAERMLRRLLPDKIELVTRLEPELAQVRADPGQIEQILMNLVVNARDAMPDGGTLQIETANAELDAFYASTHAGVVPGRYASLTVADTGHGMTAEIQAKLFEPFFTTKGVGKGTGLGLATLYGIVKQHGGHVAVYSEVDRGSSFKVHLPVAARGQDAGGTEAEPGSSEQEVRGSETILLVEDEAPVRQVVRRALEDYGYRVLAAADGAEAEAVFGQHMTEVDLLVTDWAMPGRTGHELFLVLAKARPDLRVVYMSAHPPEILRREGKFSGQQFIQKPFAFGDLVRRVRQTLDAGAADAGSNDIRETAGG